MNKHINTFKKGLDKDTNVNNYNNQNYTDAKNIRLIVDEANGSGVVTNLQGVDLSGYFTNQTIVGTTVVNDKVVIFTKGSDDDRIYYLTETQLSAPITLVKKDFNFGNTVEVIARYQSSSVTKIWWVDGVNVLRSCNLEETGLDGKPLDYFDVYSNINLPNVTFTGLTGGNLKSGSYQYVYALYSPNKAETAFTNSSTIIPITSSNYTTTKLFKGDVNGTISNKGISISITGALTANSNYSRIRIARLFYPSKDSVPEVDIVYEGQLSDNVTFNDTGNSLGTLVFEDVTKLPNIFIAKTLETKNDYLFAGNIDEEKFDIDIDMRMYQYPISNTISTYYESHTAIGGVTPRQITPGLYATIPQTYNLLNLTNVLELDDVPAILNQNKYKINSTVLGGSGLYGDFELTVTNDYSFRLDDDVTAFNVSTTSESTYSNPETYERVTYQSDEIYRFGIVFKDNKGRTSFVKWIADIRMPIVSQVLVGNALTAYINSVRFTFNNAFRTYIAANYPDIVSYQIVRCDRGNEGTVIDSGYISVLLDDNLVTELGFSPVIKTIGATSFLVEYITPSSNYSIVNKIGDRLDIIYGDNLYRKPAIKYDTNGRNIYSQKCYINDNIVRYRYGITDEFIYNFTNEQDNEKTVFTNTVTNRILNIDVGGGIDGGVVSYKASVKGTTKILKIEGIPNNSYDKYCLRRSLVYPYGGYTVAARDNSTYIPCTDAIPIATAFVRVYGGDTFISNFEQLRGVSYDAENWQNVYIANCIVESPINFNYTTGKKFSQYDDDILSVAPSALFSGKYKYCGIQEFKGAYAVEGDEIFEQFEDFYGYNSAYTPSIKTKFYPKPLDFVAEYNYPTRVYRSDKKFNSELSDSWSEFKFNNFIDLDNTYGELTKLILHNGQLMSLQPKALSLISVEPREIMPSSQGSALSVATGGIMDRYDYVTTHTGSNFQRSVLSTQNGLYFYDGLQRKIVKFSEGIEFISDTKGLLSDINNLDVIEFHTLYHPIYKEVWFNYRTINDKTLINYTYNEYLQSFISSNDITGQFSIRLENNTYFLNNASVTFSNDIYPVILKLDASNRSIYNYNMLNGVGIPQTGSSYISTIINPNGVLTNRYDILEFTIDTLETNPIQSIQFSNAYQDSGTITMNSSNLIRRHRQWRFNQLRSTRGTNSYDPRMVDTYMKLRINFRSTNNLIKLYDLITTYTPIKSYK